jgi:hypothetical protein
MALQVRRTSSIKVRIVTTLMMVFALVAQPLYGAMTATVVSANSKNITQIVFTTPVRSSQTGVPSSIISLEFRKANSNAEKIDKNNAKVTLASSSTTGQFSTSATTWQATNEINLVKDDTTASFYYKDSKSGAPVITATLSGEEISPSLSATQDLTVVAPIPQVNGENFNTHAGSDYKGFNVGFNVKDFETVSGVTVDLYKDATKLVTNTGTSALNALINNGTLQLSTPFYTQGTANDAYWVFGSRTWTAADKPTKAVVTVVGSNGVKDVTISSLSEPNGWTFESLLPPAPLVDVIAPTITNLKVTNPSLWGDNYNLLTLPNHVSTQSDLPTVGGSLNVSANFADNMALTNVIALLPGRDFFTNNEFTPFPTNNASWNPVAQGPYSVAWNTKSGAGWRAVPDGNYSFMFEARDGGSGQNNPQNSTSVPIALTVDNTAPTVSFSGATPAENTAVKGSIVVEGSFTDTNGLMNTDIGVHSIAWYCHTDWPAVGAKSCTIDTTKLTDGTYQLTMNGRDKAGNVTQIFRTITVDNTAPIVTVKSGSIGTDDIFSKVSFKLYDNNKVKKYFINGQVRTLTPNQWSDANDISVGNNGGLLGNNTFVLEDVAGNQRVYNFILDDVAPTGTVTYSNNNGNAVTANPVVVTLETNETIHTPSDWLKTSPTTFMRQYGVNGKFSVEITDLAGNKSVVMYEVKRIDNINPVINGVIDGKAYNADVAYTITEQNIKSIIIDGITYAEANALRVIKGDGSHTIQVIDKAGNSSSVAFVIDTVKPAAQLQFTAIGDMHFKVKFDENVNKDDAENAGNYFLHNWPGGGMFDDLNEYVTATYDTATTTATIKFTNVGWYVSPEQKWGVRNIRDLAGNVLNDTFDHSTRMTKPVVTVIDGTATGKNIVWTWTGLDPESSHVSGAHGASGIQEYKYQLVKVGDSPMADGWQATAAPTATTAVTDDGDYNLYVYAIDKAGNIGDDQVSNSVSVDTLAPELTVGAPVQNLDGTYHVSGTTTDANALISVELNGTLVDDEIVADQDGAWTVGLGPLVAGMTYVIKADSTDAAGNVAEQKGSTISVPAVQVSTIPSIETFATLANVNTPTPLPQARSVASVLAGNNTATSETQLASAAQNAAVLGTQDKKAETPLANTGAIAPSSQGWKIFGMAWFWWLAILAAAVAGWLWLAAAIRRHRGYES